MIMRGRGIRLTTKVTKLTKFPSSIFVSFVPFVVKKTVCPLNNLRNPGTLVSCHASLVTPTFPHAR